MVALVGVCAMVGGVALHLRGERDHLQGLLTHERTQRADDERKLATMSTPSVPLQAGQGGVFVLNGAGVEPAGSLAVLITADHSGPVWFVVDLPAAIPGQPFGLRGGRCQDGQAVAEGVDWANGSANRAGRVHFFADRLALDPADGDLWVQVRSGEQDIGGVRGPFSRPQLLDAGANPCG